MDWIVQRGVVPIPDGVSFEQAAFVEPVNTCMKGIETLRLNPGETVLVMGQGPIGIILALLAAKEGVCVISSDLFGQRLTIAKGFGILETVDASQADPGEVVKMHTGGRGADAVIVAAAGNALIQRAMDAARPGGRVLLFAQTVHSEASIDPAGICVDEKTLLGSYSASVGLQEESVRWVMGGEVNLVRLISHRFALEEAVAAFKLAAHAQPGSMKIVIQPETSEEES